MDSQSRNINDEYFEQFIQRETDSIIRNSIEEAKATMKIKRMAEEKLIKSQYSSDKDKKCNKGVIVESVGLSILIIAVILSVLAINKSVFNGNNMAYNIMILVAYVVIVVAANKVLYNIKNKIDC